MNYQSETFYKYANKLDNGSHFLLYYVYNEKTKERIMKLALKQIIMSTTEVSELNEIISLCNEVKKLNAKASLSVGQKVYVVQKTKKTLGEIVKIKISRATVKLPEGNYSVPLTMLEAA